MKAAAIKRLLFGGLGWCAVALAFAGVFVPGLPVTVFVIAASYFFSRSSPRFEAWLLAHRWFGPPLARFRNSGGMTAGAKRAALGSMWAAIAFSAVLLARVNLTGPLVVIGLGLAGSVTILYAVRTVRVEEA